MAANAKSCAAKCARIAVDKDLPTPLYTQLYENMRHEILSGTWENGEKLPSIRLLSSSLGVARNTVEGAYKQLVLEGFAASRPGSGYTVCAESATQLSVPTVMPAKAPNAVSMPGVALHGASGAKEFACDFRYGDMLASTFPLNDFKRAMNDALTKEDLSRFTSYGDPQGELDLRVHIAWYLKDARGISCIPEQIVITNGTQSSIALILGMLSDIPKLIGVENPGYNKIRGVIGDAGFAMAPLRSDAGADAFLEDVVNSNARLFYTTPSHQFPLGWCMSMDTKTQLMMTAAKANAFIIEDDYDSAYRYSAQPVPALKSLDQWDRVIYLGTFSKILSPALHLGYVVLPLQLVERYTKTYVSSRHATVSQMDQCALAHLMRQYAWTTHLHRITLGYRKRHERLISALAETFGSRVTLHTSDAGLFLLVSVHNGMNQQQLVDAAAREGVAVESTAQCWLNADDAPEDLIMLGFSAASDEMIDKGVELLERAWFGTSTEEIG